LDGIDQLQPSLERIAVEEAYEPLVFVVLDVYRNATESQAVFTGPHAIKNRLSDDSRVIAIGDAVRRVEMQLLRVRLALVLAGEVQQHAMSAASRILSYAKCVQTQPQTFVS